MAVRAYATQAREVLPTGFGVRSYAGLWLLVASLSPVTFGHGRTEVEDALGLSAAEASDLATELLAEERDDVDAAVAGWLRAGTLLPGGLPVRLGTLPDQPGLDAWAQASTRGRITSFPVTLTPETVLLLASALVAETRWLEAMEVEDDRLLMDESGLLAVVDTTAAGLVAVAVPAGPGDLDVISVIAAEELPQAQVWAAADEVASWVIDGTLLERRVPAATLAPGHAWHVVRERRSVPDGCAEVWDARLPAWSIDSSTDVVTAPGVGSVASAVVSMIASGPLDVSCVQSATATYASDGFDAAAVTVMAFMGSAGEPMTSRKVHHVSLSFDRPHAVVALARGGAWEGVPLVHAWVDGASAPARRSPSLG